MKIGLVSARNVPCHFLLFVSTFFFQKWFSLVRCGIMDSIHTFQVDKVSGFIFRLEATMSLWMYCCLLFGTFLVTIHALAVVYVVLNSVCL